MTTQNSFYNHGTYPIYGSQSSPFLDGQEWDKVALGFTAVESQLTAALSYSGAPAFSSTTASTIGYDDKFVVCSPIDGGLYRRKSPGGLSSLDPSEDSGSTGNWAKIVIGMPRVEVSTTSQVATSGNDYWLENVAATAVTAPTASDAAHFAVTPANGLLTNTIDFGAATVRGPAGTASGVITLNLGARMEFIYSSAISKWVIL